ncbi:MAG: glycosyltransferase family 2 protein [Ilumatobacteraceae bacterium]
MDLRAEVERRYAAQVEYGGPERPVHAVAPEVSVLVITYQHAAFVRECLDGILAQRTDFPFEVVIGEDGSDDGTGEICADYADAHPDVVRLFRRDRRLTQLALDPDGVVSLKRLNGRFTRLAARADVLAFCEGDDHWTDPTKLQRQYDVLRSDPGVAVVVHRAAVVWTSDEANPWQYAPAAQTHLSTEDVIWDAGTPTCAVMLRDVGLEDQRFFDWSCRTLSVDYLVRAVASFSGSTYFIDREMAVHRKHPGGLSQSPAYRDRLRLAESTRNLYLAIRDLGPPDQRALTNPKLAGVTAKLALAEMRAGRPWLAARHAVASAGYAVGSPRQLLRQRRRIWRRVGPSIADLTHSRG